MPTGLDTSIPMQVQGPQVNALQMLSQGAQVRGQMNQNMLVQQEFAARQAIGPILQQSVGADGQLDWNKFILGMSSNPDTAWKAPEVAQQALMMGKIQTEILGQQIANAEHTGKLIAQTLGPLAAKGDGVTLGDIAGAGADLVANGVPQELVMKGLARFSALPPGKPMHDAIVEMAARFAESADNMAKVNGAIGFQSQGGQTAAVQTSAVRGTATQLPIQGAPGGVLPQVPTAEQRNAVVPSSGLPRQTAGPMFTGTGAPISAPGLPMQPTAPALPPGVRGPTPPPSAAQVGVPSPEGPQAAVRPAAGPQTVATPQALQAYLNEINKNFGDYEKEVNTKADRMQNFLPQLVKLEQVAKGFRPGAGMESFYEPMARLAQAIGAPESVVTGIAGGNLGDIQQFMKLAAQNAAETLKLAIGSGQRVAVQEFMLFLDRNPNISTDPRALEGMFKYYKLIGRITLAQQQALADWRGRVMDGTARYNGRPGQMVDFPTVWNRELLHSWVYGKLNDSAEVNRRIKDLEERQ